MLAEGEHAHAAKRGRGSPEPSPLPALFLSAPPRGAHHDLDALAALIDSSGDEGLLDDGRASRTKRARSSGFGSMQPTLRQRFRTLRQSFRRGRDGDFATRGSLANWEQARPDAGHAHSRGHPRRSPARLRRRLVIALHGAAYFQKLNFWWAQESRL
ncbi:hypothetical protein T492DRAFT_237249 [Pavlovales sp. CCMP2436]|nr:hypothetical protein T492DRAFT_237249 [Pavlovales sp. CCMP2436]